MMPIRIFRPTARRRDPGPDRPTVVIRAFLRTLERLATRSGSPTAQEGSR